jgi:hypothetical protein
VQRLASKSMLLMFSIIHHIPPFDFLHRTMSTERKSAKVL